MSAWLNILQMNKDISLFAFPWKESKNEKYRQASSLRSRFTNRKASEWTQKIFWGNRCKKKEDI